MKGMREVVQALEHMGMDGKWVTIGGEHVLIHGPTDEKASGDSRPKSDLDVVDAILQGQRTARGKPSRNPAMDMIADFLRASGQSAEELRKRISNVRDGPVRNGVGYIRFKLDGETYEAPESDYVIGFGKEFDQRIALKALLSGKATKLAK